MQWVAVRSSLHIQSGSSSRTLQQIRLYCNPLHHSLSKLGCTATALSLSKQGCTATPCTALSQQTRLYRNPLHRSLSANQAVPQPPAPLSLSKQGCTATPCTALSQQTRLYRNPLHRSLSANQQPLHRSLSANQAVPQPPAPLSLSKLGYTATNCTALLSWHHSCYPKLADQLHEYMSPFLSRLGPTAGNCSVVHLHHYFIICDLPLGI